jgi:hypothetical protein
MGKAGERVVLIVHPVMKRNDRPPGNAAMGGNIARRGSLLSPADMKTNAGVGRSFVRHDSSGKRPESGADIKSQKSRGRFFSLRRYSACHYPHPLIPFKGGFAFLRNAPPPLPGRKEGTIASTGCAAAAPSRRSTRGYIPSPRWGDDRWITCDACPEGPNGLRTVATGAAEDRRQAIHSASAWYGYNSIPAPAGAEGIFEPSGADVFSNFGHQELWVMATVVRGRQGRGFGW